jgi:hypothetical protein
MIVVITAATTAVAGLGAGRRPAGPPEIATASIETPGDAAAMPCGTSPARGDRVDYREL